MEKCDYESGDEMRAESVEEARLRLFPGAFIYEGRPIPAKVLMPYYRVRVETEEERALAEQVKPPYVEAEIIVAPEG